jgi:hypothetical protein
LLKCGYCIRTFPKKNGSDWRPNASGLLAKFTIFLLARFGCLRRTSRGLRVPSCPKLTTGRQTWLLTFLETAPALVIPITPITAMTNKSQPISEARDEVAVDDLHQHLVRIRDQLRLPLPVRL